MAFTPKDEDTLITLGLNVLVFATGFLAGYCITSLLFLIR